MLEYKVMKSSLDEAEGVMNDMARQGWRVIDVTYWTNWTTGVVVTFEREAQGRDRQ